MKMRFPLSRDGGKNGQRRPEQVSKERVDLGWELRDPKTTPERKKAILERIEELKSSST